MPEHDFDLLKRRLSAYCDVNAYDLAGLKANLELPENSSRRLEFQAQLAAAVAGEFSQQAYEEVTGADFDGAAEYSSQLREIQVFLDGSVSQA